MNGGTPSRDEAIDLLRRAVRAPSSHNTQPWRFRIGDGVIDLYADRTRALPVNDPDDRELTISCGCALMNLRVAAAAARLETRTSLVPDAIDPDWLARVAFEPGGLAGQEAELSDYIELRHTWRRRFEPRPVGRVTLEQLVAAASIENAWLRPLEAETDRLALVELVGEGDAALWANPSWRRELAAWMHPRRRGDGLVVPGLVGPIAQLVVRTFDMGGGTAAKDRQLADASPLLAVLGTARDEPHDWLQAGQALERVLLTARLHGLQASYLNQPVQVPALRPKVQNLVGRGFPQLVLRFGHPSGDVAATPRRPVEDVLEP